jgi:hypothetical protein
VSPDSPWYVLLDTVADSVNPCLAVLALTVPLQPPLRHRRKLAIAYLGITAIGIMGIYAVAALDDALGIWERFAGDYSTHTAFATSLVTSVVIWKPSWTWQLCVVLLAYLILIPVIGYHSLNDVATSAIAALATTLPGQILVRRVRAG